MFRKLFGISSDSEPRKVHLSRVYSERKRKELYKILHSPNPPHNKRLWLAGFLKYAGYRMGDVEEIIANEGAWANYDPAKTREQLRGVFHIHASRCEEGAGREVLRRRSSTCLPAPYSRPSSDHDRQYSSNPGIELGKLNQELLHKAVGIVSESVGEDGRPRFSYGRPPELRPWDVPLYRTIEGQDHLLAVVDLDAEGDLERAWRVMRRLMAAHKFRWVKFSGNRGFHGIDRLRFADRRTARQHVENLCAAVDMEGLEPDPRMFNPRQLIRAFSVNWKTGQHSIAVDAGQTLEEILRSSRSWSAG